MDGFIYLASVLTGVHTLGPCGKKGRTVLWLSGCRRGCPGCMSPDFQVQKQDDCISVESLMTRLQGAADLCNGRVTISGGEPFEQPHGLGILCRELRSAGAMDILIYTGFTLNELKNRKDADIDTALRLCDVLIDGPYQRDKNIGTPMRGSANQRLHYLSDSAELRRQYEAYQKRKNQLEIFASPDGTIQVAGIWPGEGENEGI